MATLQVSVVSAEGSIFEGEAKRQAEDAMKNAKSDIDFAKAQG